MHATSCGNFRQSATNHLTPPPPSPPRCLHGHAPQQARPPRAPTCSWVAVRASCSAVGVRPAVNSCCPLAANWSGVMSLTACMLRAISSLSMGGRPAAAACPAPAPSLPLVVHSRAGLRAARSLRASAGRLHGNAGCAAGTPPHLTACMKVAGPVPAGPASGLWRGIGFRSCCWAGQRSVEGRDRGSGTTPWQHGKLHRVPAVGRLQLQFSCPLCTCTPSRSANTMQPSPGIRTMEWKAAQHSNNPKRDPALPD